MAKEKYPKQEHEQEEFSFVKEKIKKQPFYQNRMVKKACFCVLLAVVSGIIACFTFVQARPFMERTFGEDETKTVTIPREEETTAEEEPSGTPDTVVITEPRELELEDYGKLYTKLRAVARDAEKSLVTVTAASSDTDWFNETYESRQQLSGLLVGNNGVELLILTPYGPVQKASHLQVCFTDGTAQDAVLKNYDAVTNLAVLSVNLADVKDTTLEQIGIADLGSSRNLKAGEPVIAAGSPAGFASSLKFGNLLAGSHKVSLTDREYGLLITDMARSENGTGVLLNLSGQVIGLIEDSCLHTSNEQALTAYAISDMKDVIEHLMNSQDLVYMGIHGTQVTDEIAAAQGIPKGVYVSNVEPDSPALNGGIQAGVIITGINGKTVTSVTEIQEMFLKFSKEQTIQVKVMRHGREEYKEIVCSVTLDVLK